MNDFQNRTYTYHYAQPDAYHYSLDSIELPWVLAKIYHNRANLSQMQILDLCAGCGVIGFELQHWIPEIQNIDFVEIQSEYLPFFEKNIGITKTERKNFQFLNINFQDLLKHTKKYDLIVCNPPYFRLEQGTLSQNTFKNRCRFLLDASFVTLCEVLQHCLKTNGEAYVLLRDLTVNGIDQLKEMTEYFSNQSRQEKHECVAVTKETYLGISVELCFEVRGTPVVRLRHNL